MPGSVHLLSVGMFALGLDAYVVAGLLPAIANTYGISTAYAGLSVAVFTVSYALSAPVLATLLGRRSARSVLCVAMTAFTCANIASALAPTFGVLLLSRAIAGCGAGLYSPLAAACAASLAANERKGSVLGFILGGMSLGTVLGVPGGLWVAASAGWQGALWLVTAIAAAALAGIAISLPRAAPASPPSLRERLASMHDGRVVRIVGVTFLLSVASLGLYTYMTPMLSEVGAASQATFCLAAWGVGGMVGSFVIGRIVDATAHRFDIVSFICIALLSVFVIVPAALRCGVFAPAALFLWGMLGWASQAPQQHRLLAGNGGHGAGAVALNSSANYLGSAVGAALGGLLLKLGLAAHHLPFAAAIPLALALLLQCLARRGSGRFNDEALPGPQPQTGHVVPRSLP